MPVLDPEIQKYLYQQQLRGWLNNVAGGLLKAGAGGMGLGSGLAYGVGMGSQASQADPTQAFQLQNYAAEAEQRKQQNEAFQKLFPLTGQPGEQYASAEGATPGLGAPSGPTSPPGAPMLPPMLARALGREKALELYAKKALEGPPERPKVKGADGFWYYQDNGERVLPNVEARDPNLLSDAALQQKINLAREGKSSVSTTVNLPKDVTETQGMLNAIKEARASGDNDLADRLEMKLTFGGNPPEAYVKARGALDSAREGLSQVYDLVSKGSSAILPADRAKVGQAFDQVVLGYAELTNRGANFTENEQRLINSVIGGDPNDAVMRILRGDKSYLETFKQAAKAIERRGGQLIKSYTEPGVGQYQYSWEREQPSGEQQNQPSQGPAQISGDEEYDALPSGAQFIGPDGVLRVKP